MNDLTFFTNEPDRNLYERFSKILKCNTRFFDVIVGYFRLSGFFRLCDSINDIEKIRILVGLGIDGCSVRMLDASKRYKDGLITKEALNTLEDNILKEFNNGEESSEAEKGVRKFLSMLESGKLEMRMFTEAPLHAKVWIMRKDLDKCENFGSVITGSSNFSESGLINNLEFNVELKDPRDVQFALDKFEELWAKGVPVDKTIIQTVNHKTWIRTDITPYELYIKMLYEFFKDEIDNDKYGKDNFGLPSGFMDLKYQKDAVIQAKKILDAYGGVFISDVVGLGKTYICAMLAKTLRIGMKLVICPPALIDYWQDVMNEFDVACKVVSRGRLDKIEHPEKYSYVFIDESHGYRNEDTEGYSRLKEICRGKKVILISATPINNYSSDIANQLYLFQPKRSSQIVPGKQNLEAFFSALDRRLSGIEIGSKCFKEIQKENSREIRDLLRKVMVRRTRKDIQNNYADDMAKQGLKFPVLGDPIKLSYEFDDEIEKAFKMSLNEIGSFYYSRYTPFLYLDKKKYGKYRTSQNNMKGFMKGLLLKRLESSFYAFRNTIGRFISSYEKFIDMYESDNIILSPVKNIYDLMEAGKDEEIEALISEGKAISVKKSEFDKSFEKHLRRDLESLIDIKSVWDSIDRDPKLEEFLENLKTNDILNSCKKIIFTESRETAEYVGKALKENFGRTAVFSSESSDALKRHIEESFDPAKKDSGKDLYDILVTTDVLSEGVNLHRAKAVINYDLPWNPTRIMQRSGRINRVGSEFDEIFIFNFFPTDQSSKHLPLEKRIQGKLQAFYEILGEDSKYLTKNEKVSSKELYEAMSSSSDEEENPELEYLSVLRRIRDDNPKLFEKIVSLPMKIRSFKKSSERALVSFMRKGSLNAFFKSNGESSERISFVDAANIFKCDPDEKRACEYDDFYEWLKINRNSFSSIFKIEASKNSIRPLNKKDQEMLKLLKALKNNFSSDPDYDLKINRFIEIWTNGEIDDRKTGKILKKADAEDDPFKLSDIIYEEVKDSYFDRVQEGLPVTDSPEETVLSLMTVFEEE